MNEKDDKIEVVHGNKRYKMTARDMALSNNLLLEALIATLVDKGLFSQDELLGRLKEIQSDWIRTK